MATAFLAVLLLAGINDGDIIARGDVNDSGAVDASDAIYLNSFLYSGGPAPPCRNQADANHDGLLDVSDSIFILAWLYSGGPAPPSPGPFASTCSQSTLPVLGCASHNC
jgi:hypothetical protein